MKLINCYIENFGKISKQKYDFKDGFNCIVGENGSGKTTLATFIKAMLYGLGDTKKTSLEENDRKHYLPWQGGVCGGHLTFSAGPKTYRIERSFGAKAADDTYTLYDVATGKVCYDYSNPGEDLFGIDADGFERTVYLSERALAPKGNNPTVSARLANLVGCDGDIGDIDDTLKAIEEKEKFYRKKRGGGGEIADTKAKIADVNRRLEALEETEAALEREYRRLGEISEEIKKARAEATALEKQREQATLRAAEADFEKRYKQMRELLEQNVKRREEITEFFGGRIPTFDEIDAASKKKAEYEIITSELNDSPANTEYATLAAYFNGKASAEDMEKAKDAITKINEHKQRESSPDYIKAKDIFAKRVPNPSEIEQIDKIAAETKKSGSGLYAICLLVAIVGAIIGIIVHPALFAITAVCVIGLIILLTSESKKKADRNSKISEFFNSVNGKLPQNEEIQATLAEMKRLYPVISAFDDRDKTEATAFLTEMSVKLNGQPSEDLVAFAKETIEKHEKLLALAMADKYMSGNRAARAERALKLSGEVKEFLVGIKTVSDDPFAEIRRALSEYMRLTADIVAKREEIASYQSRHVIGEGEERMATLDVSEIDRQRFQLDGKIANLEREHALSDRASRNYSDQLEERHELLQKRIELEEKLSDITEKYEIILQTKKFISLAADNMTSRYIGKTVESFKKYNEAIAGEGDVDFQMDTDFGISRIEGTATKGIEAYSRGTKDLYNLSARLALVDSLYDKERPFIIFDDPFTALDDEKTKSALRLLKKFANDSQVIYFTCSKSRSS